MARINARVMKSNGAPYPPNPGDVNYPTHNQFIAENEAKQTPDDDTTKVGPGQHPSQIWDGSGGHRHRVNVG